MTAGPKGFPSCAPAQRILEYSPAIGRYINTENNQNRHCRQRNNSMHSIGKMRRNRIDLNVPAVLQEPGHRQKRSIDQAKLAEFSRPFGRRKEEVTRDDFIAQHGARQGEQPCGQPGKAKRHPFKT